MKTSMRIVCWTALLCGIVSLACLPARGENWPQWRGPSNDGVSHETGLATQWSQTQNIAWKLPLPNRAGSTPVVWGDRLFLSTPGEDGSSLLLMCVDLGGAPGKVLWSTQVGSGGRDRGGENNGASPSPSTDGKHVWVFYGTGDLACLDFDGKIVWKTNIQDRYGKFRLQFGMHSTPVLDGDRLYLQLIHSGGAWVIALDKATGKELWKHQRKSDGRAECEHSYASPVMWRDGESACLVTHGNDYAIGHSLVDGHELWRVGDLNPKSRYNATLRFVASPVATPGLIVVPTAKGGAVVGVKPTAKGYVDTGSEYEQWRITRGTPDVASPLVHDGLVYLALDNGTLACLDATSGQELYHERLHNAIHRASPVWADGKVYVAGRDGVVSVVKAGRQFQMLAQNKLDDQLSASPVISGGRIYLRGFSALYAIESGK